VRYNGIEYGQRDWEFRKILGLPQLTAQSLRIALTGGGSELLRAHGWQVVDGWEASRTTATYRQFIHDSAGEFGVAKHCYVATRGAWVSDRSVCYLASGRPIVVQETGTSDCIPTDAGMLTFTDVNGAARQIERVAADYAEHRKAARRLAEEFFSADRILPQLLDQAVN
jgi:hypothetical protein